MYYNNSNINQSFVNAFLHLEIIFFHALEWFLLKNESANLNSDRLMVVLSREFISLLSLMYSYLAEELSNLS